MTGTRVLTLPMSDEPAANRSDSTYPPGVPVVAPGEVITEEVLDYLRSGADHGVLTPDAADSSVRTLRVVAREANKRR
ncbi:hypothetical protein [Streptomyces sp. WAC04114]|uniref:Orn/Lys/Arg family decarboxylase n=1 Tax=Streptomyces sp. WAC04114 TaxID=2867961 RepID=UPI001C8BC35A|nr:hypothetical protein [Streptomyces sp. WAC04114]MBX9360395.1 hypothetical protein [Streptomyces sp. WAC04114]